MLLHPDVLTYREEKVRAKDRFDRAYGNDMREAVKAYADELKRMSDWRKGGRPRKNPSSITTVKKRTKKAVVVEAASIVVTAPVEQSSPKVRRHRRMKGVPVIITKRTPIRRIIHSAKKITAKRRLEE